MKKCYNIELKKREAGKLHRFLNNWNMEYEPSSAGDMVHFEIFLDKREFEKVEEFLETL